MNTLLIPTDSWVLVCDGAKALIYVNEGDTRTIKLTLVAAFEAPQPPARDLGTDRPGRVYQSHGAARSAVDSTDWHAAGEAAFLHMVAADLDSRIADTSIRGLIVVAPPKALGLLRGLFTPAVKALITDEIAKDLTGMPTETIPSHLTGSAS